MESSGFSHAYQSDKYLDTMNDQLIPWQLFIVALKARFPRDFQEWLSFWRFGDEGVIFFDDLKDLDHVVRILLPDPEEKKIH